MASQQDIANVVAALGSSGGDLSSPIKSGHAGYIYDSSSDTFTQTSAAPAAGIAAQALPDDGRDLGAARDEIVTKYNSLVAKLQDASITGRARAVLEQQVRQASASGNYDLERINATHQQRLQGENPMTAQMTMADGTTTTLEQAAARSAFVDSAPPGMRVQYGKDYDDRMREARVSNVTGAVFAATRNR
jgi:hypothetical protein